MLHNFKIEKWWQSSKVMTRAGEIISFVDNRTFSQDEVYEFMHKAYEQGISDGRASKAKDVREILKL